jgi:hypothetical protein
LIKSFSAGFAMQGQNTQTTMKAASRIGLRTSCSTGGKFGTDPYRLESIQERGENDLNYLPPLPMDGTKYFTFSDDNELDKYFYVVQDEPGPLQITSTIVDANYTVGA